MPAATADRYVRAVRVVIDFGAAGTWAGTLEADAPTPATSSFVGRLDLLRQLEILLDRGVEGSPETTAPG